MLELNKEYTYAQICAILGWKVFISGEFKKAQIKEIESAYEFYHPIIRKHINLRSHTYSQEKSVM